MTVQRRQAPGRLQAPLAAEQGVASPAEATALPVRRRPGSALLHRLLRPRPRLAVALGGERLEPVARALLLEAMQREFSRPGMRSTTAALRDAPLAAHALLRSSNAAILPQERRYVSAACAVVGRGGAYVALAGWAHAYRVGQGPQRILTARTEHLSPMVAPRLLGGQGKPSVSLHHLELQPGDRLALVVGRDSLAWSPAEGDGTPLEPRALAATLRDRCDATDVIVLDASGSLVAQEPAIAHAEEVESSEGSTEAASPRPSGPRSGPLTAAMSVLVLLLLGLGFWLSQSSPEQQVAADVREIRRLVAAAEQARSRDQAIELLQLASGQVDRVGAGRVPGELLAQVRQATDRANGVERLGESRTLVILGSAGVGIDQMEVAGEDLYLLDAAAGAVHLFTAPRLASSASHLGSGSLLLATGLPVQGRIVGHPLAMAWVPAGRQLQRPVLVMADTERTFTTYDPRLGLGRFAPPESDQWVRLGPAAGADGAAYVVDVGRGRLLEYPLALPGGALPPRSVLDPQSSAGLAGAVEIAVSSEEVYVLLRDGRLLRYNLAGQRLPFPGLVPDRPLDAPTGLALGLRGGGVYVADAGNQRVVQFSRAGEFVRQFQATAQAAGLLAGLRAVRVDEAAHRLVGLTSRAVLLFDLPPEGP